MSIFKMIRKVNAGENKKSPCVCTTVTDGVASSVGSTDITGARFIVLGACCKKSTQSFINVKQAVADLGFKDEVINIGDVADIASYGVMQTPALVIADTVVSYGTLIKVDDAKKLIEKSGLKP